MGSGLCTAPEDVGERAIMWKLRGGFLITRYGGLEIRYRRSVGYFKQRHLTEEEAEQFDKDGRCPKCVKCYEHAYRFDKSIKLECPLKSCHRPTHVVQYEHGFQDSIRDSEQG